MTNGGQRAITYGAILALAIPILFMLWMIHDPRQHFWVQYSSPTLTTADTRDKSSLRLEPQARAGQAIHYYREICYRTTFNRGTIYALISSDVSPYIFRYPVLATPPTGAGCHKRLYTLVLPAGMPPGPYRLDAELVLPVNAIMTRTYPLPPVRFEVAP